MSSSVAEIPAARTRLLDRATIVAASIVALVTAMRAIAAARVPVIGDEGYYWEWSRHLALGYADHPPMVAYAIYGFAWIGTNPFAVRLPFILCGVIAAYAAALTATRLAGGDRRAGAVAALAVTLAPLASVSFGSASPDGPYLAAWAVSLYFAVRAFASGERRDYALLGAALGVALLCRVFSFALVFGIVAYAFTGRRRTLFRGGLWFSLGIAFVLYVPFLVWNANHGWATFVFALGQRHVPKVLVVRPLWLHLYQAGAYSPGLWVGALICLFRRRQPLLVWTAAPLIALLTVLAIREPVEVHWMFGPYVSLAIAIGVAYVGLARRARVIWATVVAVPAVLLFPLIFIAAIAPGSVYQWFRGSTDTTLRNTGPFEIFTVPSLARDVRQLADANEAMVVTDGYGLSATLDFYGGVPPVVIGYNAQGQESKRWYDADAMPKRLLFVDKEALLPRPGHPEDRGRPDFARQLARACGAVSAGPTLGYAYRDPSGRVVPVRPYFTTWCDRLRPHALHILQFDPAYGPTS